MLRFFALLGRRKEFVVLSVAVGLSVWMLSLKQDDKFNFAFSVSSTLLQFGQKAFSRLTHLMDLEKENEELQQKAARLFLENSLLKEAERENERLRELLGFQDRSQFQLVPAEVIGWNPDRNVNSILINIGHVGGIRRNMPVITPDGLVGKVCRVMPYVSVVQLLLDPNCRVSSVVQRSRVFGIVEWEKGTLCLLRNIPVMSDVREGDTIVTSGMGGIFPKGLRVGSVQSVTEEKWGLFKKVTVNPEVDFTHLEEVFVLINEDRTKSSLSDRSVLNPIDTR